MWDMLERIDQQNQNFGSSMLSQMSKLRMEISDTLTMLRQEVHESRSDILQQLHSSSGIDVGKVQIMPAERKSSQQHIAHRNKSCSLKVVKFTT
jgi:hypothetical protein